jgi:phosphatidate cytidylyltransferase
LDSIPTPSPLAPTVAARSSVAYADRLSVRLVTAAIGIPLTVVLVALGLPWLFWGVAAVIVVASAEFYRMLERVGYQPVWEAGLAAGVVFALQAAWPQPWQEAVLPAVILYTVGVHLRRGRLGRAVANTALTLFGAIYVGYLMSYILRLRALGLGPAGVPGPTAALLVVFSVWAADSAAYFVGLGAGRRKLFPGISPNKSVEGAAGGIVAAIVAGLACGAIFHVALPMAGLVAGLCAIASILGDLWESTIKREVGVKDAGGILPGHGGMLDRFDGLLFAMAIGYYAIRWWPWGR